MHRSYCYTPIDGNVACGNTGLLFFSCASLTLLLTQHIGHGYSLSILNSNDQMVTIGSSWTLGLPIHPVGTLVIKLKPVFLSSNYVVHFFFWMFLDIACAISFAALLLSFSQHLTITLIASLVSFLAAIITLIAFAIDIALYAYFKHQMGMLGFGSNTTTGPGTFILFTSCSNLLITWSVKASGSRLLP